MAAFHASMKAYIIVVLAILGAIILVVLVVREYSQRHGSLDLRRKFYLVAKSPLGMTIPFTRAHAWGQHIGLILGAIVNRFRQWL
jgi:hypothetical protein